MKLLLIGQFNIRVCQECNDAHGRHFEYVRCKRQVHKTGICFKVESIINQVDNLLRDVEYSLRS